MQKVAAVTGAARGIGLATVKRFLVDGWRVALLDIDEETLNRSAADLHTDAVLAICCDVSLMLRELQKHLQRLRKHLAGSMSW
jgi:NAD(P)-dependent dehydrogenase (short-subunit alcohol dehydrogenase family)